MPLEQRSFRTTQLEEEPEWDPEPKSGPGSNFSPSMFSAAPMVAEVIELSGPMEVDLSIYRGDTGRFRITVTNEDLSPVDLTGATWDADIRTTAAAPTVITSFDVVPVVGDDSSVDVILDETNAELLPPGNLVYDVEMRLDGEIVTLVTGKITVTQDVSRPT